MLSKAKIKEIKSLEYKKFRDEKQLFIAEGNKLVSDILKFFRCEYVLAEPSWMETHTNVKASETVIAGKDDIKKVSFLKTPQEVFAIFKKPNYSSDDIDLTKQLIIALDNIQDPGNLGTIVRTAAWFGIKDIICSIDTADLYSPKTVQATMGAISSVRVHYTNLAEFLSCKTDIPVYGAFLNGDNIYKKKLSPNGVIVMGNEGKGIRPEIELLINNRLHIPSSLISDNNPESLNVAVATAIVVSEFKRTNY
jgi:TrmH family RNA methyltransferase